MLIGEYKHNLDPKKRLAIPAKFRKEMGKKMVVTKGLDQCLFVYPLVEWAKEAEKRVEEIRSGKKLQLLAGRSLNRV